jgi:hypothetical protein
MSTKKAPTKYAMYSNNQYILVSSPPLPSLSSVKATTSDCSETARHFFFIRRKYVLLWALLITWFSASSRYFSSTDETICMRSDFPAPASLAAFNAAGSLTALSKHTFDVTCRLHKESVNTWETPFPTPLLDEAIVMYLYIRSHALLQSNKQEEPPGESEEEINSSPCV